MNTTPYYFSYEYTKHSTQVELVSDVYEGVDSASTHLTKFPREDDTAYADRQSKATLKNFVKRIATSTRNILLNKPPIVNVVPAIEPLLNRIDKKQSLEAFMQEVALYQLLDGFVYVVVDAPVIDETIQTRSDEQRLSINPYMYVVRRNNVVNWKLKEDGTFARVTIREAYEKLQGRYDSDYGEQYRTYFEDGTVEVWRDSALVETIQLGINRVPVVKVGKYNVPTLYDISKLNVNHMNRRSNLDRYLTIAALPVPVIYGNTADANLVVGVDDAISFSDKTESGFQWVEVSGSSIKALQEDLIAIEESILQEAVILTSNDLTVAKNEAQVSAETLEGFGRLTYMATQLELGMNEALDILASFKNIQSPGTIELNKEFKSGKMSSDQVKDLVQLHANGLISVDTALTALIEGQVVDVPDVNIEKAKLNEPL